MKLKYTTVSGDESTITVDADTYSIIAGAVARHELPEQTLAPFKGDELEAEPDDPSKTDGYNSTRQQTAPGKTAVPPTSTPAMTGAPKPPNEGEVVSNPFASAPVDAAEDDVVAEGDPGEDTDSTLGDNGGNAGTAKPVARKAAAKTATK